MERYFTLRHLSPDSPYVILANLLIGMIFMVTIHSLFTALRGEQKSYLFLGFFFIGALINSLGNISGIRNLKEFTLSNFELPPSL